MADFNFTLKRGVGGADTLYPKTTWTQVADKPATFTPTAHTLTSHSDVTITSPSTGQVLKYNGTAWVNGTDVAGTGDVVGAASSTEGDIVTFSGTTGKVIQGTGLTVTEIVNAISEKADIVHNHAATAITSGTISTARLGSGTASSSTFLRGDNTWVTPAGTGDVVGPASSVTARIATFNGTTGKLIQDSGTLISGLATSTHSHHLLTSTGTFSGSPATIASGDRLVIVDSSDSSRISHASLSFGTATSSFLANNGTFQRLTYESRLGSNINTAVNTTAVLVFSFTLPAGEYEFESVGFINKNNSTSTRQYQVIFSCDSTTGYSNILAYAQFSPNTAVTQDTGNAMNLSHSTLITTVTAAITGTAGSLFAGTNTQTQVLSMPYRVVGRIELTAQRTFRMHIRQTAGTSTDTVGVSSGSYMRVYKFE
jgi:hypothetical protein